MRLGTKSNKREKFETEVYKCSSKSAFGTIIAIVIVIIIIYFFYKYFSKKNNV